jgi:protein required for attachment to host cells
MFARLAAKTWVLVADGGRARVLENSGDALAPRLEQVWARTLANPPARDQGSDRPGRYHDGMSPHRSAVEATDFHAEAEKTFMAEVATKLDGEVAAGRFKDLVVVAEPRALGHLRAAMSARLKTHVRAEIAKDYTSAAADTIATLVAKELAAG